MADIKNIQVDGVDYAIKDESARNSIGDLSQLTTEAKDDLVSALNELSAGAGSGSGPIQRIESLDESNLLNLRDLETGSYVLYGYFRPYAGASNYLPFDNLLVNVYHVDEGSHLFEFSTANSEVNFIEILVDSTADSGFTYSRTAINMLELSGLIAKLGNLDDLTTTEKGTVVGAINEVAASGGSDSGSSVQPDLSQNDPTQPDYVKNRTHWEEGNQTVIEWDGNTEGLDSFTFGDAMYYKVSDLVPLQSEVVGGAYEIIGGTVIDITSDYVVEGEGCFSVVEALVVKETSCTFGGTQITAPSTGCYFGLVEGIYTTKLTYGSVTVHPLDEKFIPESVARKADTLPMPPTASAGQFIVVSAADENGVVTATEAVTIPNAEEASF